jgi:hypothetical protein
MKYRCLSISSSVLFLVLAWLFAASPSVVKAYSLPSLADSGSKSGGANSIEQTLSDEAASLLISSAVLTPTMTISQTLSDEAQRNTIAFDGLAFLTGSLCGALIGAVAALLLAPYSGGELRQRTRERLGTFRDDIREAYDARREQLEAELESLRRPPSA